MLLSLGTVATGKVFRDFVSHWQPRLREFDYAQRGAPVCGFLALACWYILAHAWGRNRPRNSIDRFGPWAYAVRPCGAIGGVRACDRSARFPFNGRGNGVVLWTLPFLAPHGLIYDLDDSESDMH